MSRSKVVPALIIILVGLVGFTGFAVAVDARAQGESLGKWAKVGDVFIISSRRGTSIFGEDGKISKENATLQLIAEVTEVGNNFFKFKIRTATVEFEGARYDFASGEGGLRISARGALIGIKGAIQNGEVKLGGNVHLRNGRVVVVLVGELATGNNLRVVRFLSFASKP